MLALIGTLFASAGLPGLINRHPARQARTKDKGVSWVGALNRGCMTKGLL